MFDIFAKLLSSITSFLFPLFASYKALKTSDPAQLTPWLMYWVVLACALLFESWTEWILVWIPLYPYLRLLFLLYLVLPQTQGARLIYTQHVHPYLEKNETQIEDLIATAHDKMRAAGMAYLKRAVEMFKTQVLGMAPTPESESSAMSDIPASQRPRSYTQALLDRFKLPQARLAGPGGGTGQDFYNFLASAVSAAAVTISDAGAAQGGESSSSSNAASAGASGVGLGGGGAGRGVGAFPSSMAESMSASGTLVPPNIRGAAEKMTFLAAQRERLSAVLSALDREAQQIDETSRTEDTNNLDGAQSPGSTSPSRPALEAEDTVRPNTSASGASGLSKSRSEADFEKIDAESGAEDNVEGGIGSARPTPAAATGSGSWMPWGWGAGGAASSAGKDSEEHPKTE